MRLEINRMFFPVPQLDFIDDLFDQPDHIYRGHDEGQLASLPCR